MAFNTYAQGYKLASDLSSRAINTESSLSTLALQSPLPTLQKAFTLYISAAEAYSHLLSSNLAPDVEKPGLKKKWRLVLERAEKVKARVEALGAQVGKVDVGDEGEEEEIRRRGGRLNGLDLPFWREPSSREYMVATAQPALSADQVRLDAEWAPFEWGEERVGGEERWVVMQGAGADCSVVAGLGVCMEHNRRWKRKLAWTSTYPRTDTAPTRSENGKHVIKLLLNGAWRSVVIDALLPRTKGTHYPIHATSHVLGTTPPEKTIGLPWIPIALKGFFKAHGGYSLRGSNPAPDIYAFTGWIPERCSFREGFRREKEWTRIHGAFHRGNVLVSLGTGKTVDDGLIPLHAYAVFDLREENSERLVEIFDPGLPAESACSAVRAMADLTLGEKRKTGLFTMSWDQVCAGFDAVHLNWNPELRPVHAIRHWSWPKQGGRQLRYRLNVESASGQEVWVLLSQHLVSQDRALDDIALHVVDHGSSQMAPYTNSQHVLTRHVVRDSLLVIPSRDRGVGRTDFTLQAFGPPGSVVSLERVNRSLPFTQTLTGKLGRSGGHSGWSSYGSNPQYRLDVPERCELRLELSGDGGVPWNIKLLWSSGGLVHDVTQDAVVADSGPHSFGLALAQATVKSGTYTLAVSAFEPGQVGTYELSIETSVAVKLEPIPAEGAGMYHRHIEGVWSPETSGGRPSGGSYHLNPHIELVLPRSLSLQCRLHHPDMHGDGLGQADAPVPLNLTLFERAQGGAPGRQLATSGAYSNARSGVRVARTRVGEGAVVLVPSVYERGMGVGVGKDKRTGRGKGKRWRVDVWADASFELELV